MLSPVNSKDDHWHITVIKKMDGATRGVGSVGKVQEGLSGMGMIGLGGEGFE